METIRPLMDLASLKEASRLEAVIWGAHDPTPKALLTVFAYHGGVVLGAFDGSQMVGVVVGFPAIDASDRLYLHSHLLGVLPAYRRRHIGERLKWAEWQFAEARGFSYVGWTYDPLMAANAWFNLGVLGARVADVQENVYGPLGDGINGGLPTHRFWVEWNPNQKRPALASGSEVRQVIPQDVAMLRQRDPRAAELQANRFFAEARALFEAGFRVSRVERQGDGVAYLWSKEADV